MNGVIKLIPNRVRRNYRGGAGIDWLHDEKIQIDSECPEEWVASTTVAHNPGMGVIENEGLSQGIIAGKRSWVREILNDNADFYFGERYVQEKGTDPGFLFKVLDSSMRLHVQVHPTKQFAQEYLSSAYGKLECYYILHIREGVDPYIRLGFQHPPTKAEWKEIITSQNMAAMDACFEKIPVKEGDIWYVPGGMPHAIGEGILMLEIMEPSDLVVRCEFNREGVVVPPEARFMNRDLDFCLNVFDYTAYSIEEVEKKCKLSPKRLFQRANSMLEGIIDSDLTESFKVKHLEIKSDSIKLSITGYTVGIITTGRITIKNNDQTENFCQGDSFLIAAGVRSVEIIPEDGNTAEIFFVMSVL